jgi:predicted transcriptional regulator of viral defense system
MTIEDLVLRELHRAALEAGRRGIAVPSADVDAVARRVGGRMVAEQALKRLAQAQRVVRVRRDLLVLPDATGLLSIDLVDLIDAVAPQPYLITAGGALEHFDLTDQYSFGLVVLVPSEVTTLRYRGQTATFFKTDPTNIWGWEPEARPRYALPERALVDALNHPRYGVSLTQTLDALGRAASRDSAFLDRLLASVRRYSAGSRGHSSRSSARRVGLVVERLFGANAAAPYRDLVGTNRTPVLMRPGGSPSGPVDSTWRVMVNAVLEPETVS